MQVIKLVLKWNGSARKSLTGHSQNVTCKLDRTRKMTKVNKPLIKLLLLQIVFFIGISNVNSQIEKPYNSAIKINLTETAILNPTVSYETNLYKISNIEFDIGYYS